MNNPRQAATAHPVLGPGRHGPVGGYSRHRDRRQDRVRASGVPGAASEGQELRGIRAERMVCWIYTAPESGHRRLRLVPGWGARKVGGAIGHAGELEAHQIVVIDEFTAGLAAGIEARVAPRALALQRQQPETFDEYESSASHRAPRASFPGSPRRAPAIPSACSGADATSAASGDAISASRRAVMTSNGPAEVAAISPAPVHAGTRRTRTNSRARRPCGPTGRAPFRATG